MSVIHLTKDNFNLEVLETSVTVLVDFWADWCGPCKILSPIIEEIAAEGHPGVKVCKVNADEEPELAGHFGIMGIPTVMAFKDGRVKGTSVGVKPKEEILKLLG
ncbi:MAG: thioredoxin [Peptococcaceae bacterium]|nr:thioredoxin [Peptococcaceae bacterium]